MFVNKRRHGLQVSLKKLPDETDAGTAATSAGIRHLASGISLPLDHLSSEEVDEGAAARHRLGLEDRLKRALRLGELNRRFDEVSLLDALRRVLE